MTGRALAERFWERVDVGEPNECWPWMGYRDKDGYGRLKTGSRTDGSRKFERANRVAFRLTTGHEAEGWVLHTCDNPPCCNPGHLYDGTPDDNGRDMRVRVRHPKRLKAKCAHGHEFTPDNTYWRSNGTRACVACRTRRSQARRERVASER